MVSSLPHGVVVTLDPPSGSSVINLDNEVLAFVGAAPIFTATSPSSDELKLIRSSANFAELFGERDDRYSLSVIQSILNDYGVVNYLAVNVFDPESHTGTKKIAATLGDDLTVRLDGVVSGDDIVVSAVDITPPAGQTFTESSGGYTYDTTETLITDVVLIQDGVSFEEGRDFTVDGGIITLVGDRIDGGESIDVGFKSAGAELTLNTDYEISESPLENSAGETYESISGYSYSDWILTGIGGTDAGDEWFISYTAAAPEFVPTLSITKGIEKLKLAQSEFGFVPTHITADRFTEEIVSNALEIMANDLRCQYHITIPEWSSVDEALAGRGGTDGRVKNAFTDDPNALLYSEWVRYPNASQTGSLYTPQHWHGMAARAVRTARRGFWWSISSSPLVNALGIQSNRTMSREDASADNQSLIGAGYTTLYSEFGRGLMFDGNYNAAFPTVVSGIQFAAVNNARQTVIRSALNFTQTALDKPLTRASSLVLKRSISEYIENLSDENRNAGQALAGGTVDVDILQLDQSQGQQLGILEGTSDDQRQGRITVFLEVNYLSPINVVTISDNVTTSI